MSVTRIRKTAKGRKFTHCRECQLAGNKKNYSPQKQSRWNREQGLKRYGLTIDDYENMAAQQGDACAICGRNPGKLRLAVDHCHTTGKVRGLLCADCNTFLGRLEKYMPLLSKCFDYLGVMNPLNPNNASSSCEQ